MAEHLQVQHVQPTDRNDQERDHEAGHAAGCHQARNLLHKQIRHGANHHDQQGMQTIQRPKQVGEPSGQGGHGRAMAPAESLVDRNRKQHKKHGRP